MMLGPAKGAGEDTAETDVNMSPPAMSRESGGTGEEATETGADAGMRRLRN